MYLVLDLDLDLDLDLGLDLGLDLFLDLDFDLRVAFVGLDGALFCSANLVV